MTATLFAAVLALSAAQAPAAAVRSVNVAVLDKKDVPVQDLQASELALVEDGQPRTVLGIERDTRPLEVAVVVDSSDLMKDEYRSTLAPAVIDFWRSLPPDARVSIWTSGSGSKQVVVAGTSVAEGEPKLLKVAPGGGNQGLYAIVDAAQELGTRQGPRRMLVMLVGSDLEANPTLVQKVNTVIAQARAVPLALLLQLQGGVRQSWDSETVFERMAQGYGGIYRLALSPTAAVKALKYAAGDLTSQYRVRYESTATQPTRPEVKLSRKGLKSRVSLSEPAR